MNLLTLEILKNFKINDIIDADRACYLRLLICFVFLSPSREITLDRATYIWLWLNTLRGR